MQTAYLVFIIDSDEPLVDQVTAWLNEMPSEIVGKLPIVRGLISDEMPDFEDIIELYACTLRAEMHDEHDDDGGSKFVFGELK